jgi:toxin YoeB
VRTWFSSPGWDDYTSWAGDRAVLARVNRLITEAARDPDVGDGEPVRLSGNLAGCWSRRIDQEHRLVYTFDGADLAVLQARFRP